jgi:hypothetical protein
VRRTESGWYEDKRTQSEYPPVGELTILAYGTYDYRKEIIEVLSPPFDVETFAYYDVQVDASLDGQRYFGTPLKFTVYDLQITGLSPNCGPLDQTTRVKPVTRGLIKSKKHWCRADFPEDVDARRDLPGKYDNTRHEIEITMPSLKEEVKKRVDLATAALPEPEVPDPAVDEDGALDVGEKQLPPPAVDPDGGLNGLPVPVELTLNGQNYTEDRVEFVYYGHLDLGEVELELPEGVTAEAGLPIDQEMLCPIQNLPEGLELDTAVVVFKVVSLTAEDPANPAPEDFVTTETVPAALHYRGNDAVLLTNVPPILATRVPAEQPPEKATVRLELSLNGQHFMEVRAGAEL